MFAMETEEGSHNKKILSKLINLNSENQDLIAKVIELFQKEGFKKEKEGLI
jgi:hypothetical protein